MFERFTDGARQVVVLAQEEARAIGHDHIGTEHLLLGLVRVEDGVAAQALATLGVRFEDVRAQIVRVAGSGETATTQPLPFTPRAKKVLELALRETLALGDRDIDTEHVLLGLVREGSGVGAAVLRESGADTEKVRGAISAARDARGIAAVQGSPVAFAGWLGRLLIDATARVHGSGRPDGGDILLALARDRDGVAARALAELGLGEQQLHAAVERARAGPE